MNPFAIFKRADTSWIPVGLMSSFPEVGSDDENLVHPRSCKSGTQSGCRVFDIPKEDISQRREVPVQADGERPLEDTVDLESQVVVFRHRGKIHAVDNECPHQSFPLSDGTPFDIEDFGVVLSAGIICPKHGWSFDLFTGQSDRGMYRLPVWQVDLRDAPNASAITEEDGSVTPDKEVWIRRKPRIG